MPDDLARPRQRKALEQLLAELERERHALIVRLVANTAAREDVEAMLGDLGVDVADVPALDRGPDGDGAA